MTLQDYRGIGLTLGRLQFDFDKKSQISTTKKSIHTTLQDFSRGRTMLAKVNSLKVSKLPVSTKADKTEVVAGASNVGNTVPKSPSSQNSKDSVEIDREVICISPDLFETSQNDDSVEMQDTSDFKRDELTIGPEPPKLPENVDLEFLKELPKDIARELAQHYGINESDIETDNASNNFSDSSGKNGVVNPYTDIESIDPGYLNALPASLRNEVLIQFQEVLYF